jgi:hypothetical protein
VFLVFGKAKTAYLLNRGVNHETVDGVRDKLQEWGCWKLVERAESADLLLVRMRFSATDTDGKLEKLSTDVLRWRIMVARLKITPVRFRPCSYREANASIPAKST